ncbi:MAG: N-glycosylase/DNA lyase [Candidatus Altiarchaeota archaeon]|nr:N-glycosylase/DNA lyase [Candidatus Altiarchaeota archaeon]
MACDDILVNTVKRIKNSGVRRLVDSRMREFKALGRKSNDEIFKELCFCILTANFQANRSIEIQREIGGRFITLSQERLAGRLRALGHRFPNTRASYIVEARRHKGALKETMASHKDERELRDWVVRNVKGLGYKEASHFLRNIGYLKLAIIDFHIVDILVRHRLMRRPKSLSRNNYLRIERLLERLAGRLKLSLAELDLYLWYCETGTILK